MLPRLKQLRRERGISQQQLAQAVNVSQQSINQYENHDIEPDIATLSRMAAFFDTSIDYIVERVNERHASTPTEAYLLTASEARIIAQYRALTDRERQCIAAMLDTLLYRPSDD